MRPIDKFILHVVHNLFPLNEYSEGELKKLMAQFKEEADDLGIEITDDQLKSYITRFDALKNSPKVTDKDLRKYTLSKLIKLVTSSAGAEVAPDKEDDTPDVVYHEEPYIIWNGSKEGNCIKYGAGEKWCITRGSFSSYRYSSGRGYPVFYLAKNNSMSDDNKLSFVAIQVRDVDRESERYVYTNRKNSPYESSPMSWEQLNREIPWLSNIPNVKSIMKYIPISSQEKLTQKYAYDAVGIREWVNFPFETKKQYLVVRGPRGQFFSDINNDIFIEKYLPKYPQIANFVAITPGLVNSKELLKNLDKFSNQDRKSITANLRDKVNLEYLQTDIFPWDVKKLITSLNKWDITPDDRIYVTKDGSAIVKLKLGDNIKVSIYTEEDDYPNVKLNKRTSKFLLDYPELDKIPFKNLMKLVVDDVIDKNVVTKLLDDAKTNPNSAIIVKQIEDGEIILDSNSFASYKIDKDGGILPVPFDNEEVQAAFDDAKNNEGLQQNALALIRYGDRIPKNIDRKSFISVLRAIPLDKRVVEWRGNPSAIITTENDKILVMVTGRGTTSLQLTAVFGDSGDWTIPSNGGYSSDPAIYRAYFTYLGTQSKKYNDNELINVVRSAGQSTGNSRVTNAIIEANPPMVDGNLMKPVMYQGNGYIVNTQNPRESYGVSSASGKLVKANISPAQAASMLGLPAPAAAAVAAGRRGRPAGGGAPRQQTPAAPAAAGDINVGEVMQETGLDTAFLRLPRSIIRRLNVTNASRVAPNGDRGAARRNNQLGNRGTVGRVIAIDSSKIYFIRLASGQIIASINVQPGNYNYILTGNNGGNNAISLNSPSDLVQVLTQRGLAEHRSYIVREYLNNNPKHVQEVRDMVAKHIDEISAKKAVATGALALGLLGTPSLTQAQNTIKDKFKAGITAIQNKIKPQQKADTIKIQKDAPLVLAKFKDYKGAGYGYAESKDQQLAMDMARMNATSDLMKKLGKTQMTAGIEEKSSKLYQNADGTYAAEVLVVIGNM
jgi:hypothetical protein